MAVGAVPVVGHGDVNGETGYVVLRGRRRAAVICATDGTLLLDFEVKCFSALRSGLPVSVVRLDSDDLRYIFPGSSESTDLSLGQADCCGRNNGYGLT